jgi:hypothetical protein
MALTSLQRGGRGVSFDDYFKMALGMNTQKLEAIIRGQDHSLPIVAAMAAYEVKKPMATAMQGQQAQAELQQPQPTIRGNMEQGMDGPAMIPDMAMLQQQRMGPQPPVLPEQSGVGALPAPNMEGMGRASGGIIAFDDGGEVERYADTGFVPSDVFMDTSRNPLRTSEMREAEEKRAEAERTAEEGRLMRAGERTRRRKEDAEAQAQLEKLSKERREARKKGETVPSGPVDLRPDESAAETARLQRQNDSASGVRAPRTEGRTPENTVSAPTPAKGKGKAASTAPVPAPVPAPAAPEKTGIDAALEAQQKLSGSDAEVRSMLSGFESNVASGIETLRAAREEGKPTGKAYEKYEASLMEEGEAVKGKEQRNLQMALVNAGLAIAGGTSQFALENIGKGALVGTKQYMEGIDKLEAAAKERQKMMAMIEEARRAEARSDFKDKMEFETKAFDTGVNARKMSIEALAKIYDTNKKGATDIFNNMEQNKTRLLAEKEQSRSRKEVAEISADAQRYAANKYSARTAGGQPNVAIDNARARWEKWLSSPEGKTASLKPGASDRKYQEFLRAAFLEMGLEPPAGAGAAPTGGNLPPLDPRSTPDLFK